MKTKASRKRSARYRPTIITRIHYLIWSLIIMALWPVGRLFRLIEKLRRYA